MREWNLKVSQIKMTYDIVISIYLSKSIMETPEQCVIFVQSYNKDTRVRSMVERRQGRRSSVLLLTQTDFTYYSGDSIVHFKHVNASWVTKTNVY